MKISNKKGIGLEWYALILAFFIGLGFYSVNYLGEHKLIQNYIGQYQFSIIKSANEAEKILFYIDQSAKYALQQSVYELAQNGISISEFELNEINIYQIFERNKCGKFKDAYIWYELKKDASGNYIKNSCLDDKALLTNLIFIFDKNLNQYLINSPYNIPRNNYNYEAKDNLEIIGKAISSLKFDILKDENKPIIKKPAEIQIEQLKLKDSTDSGEKLCAKGVRCALTEEAYQLMVEAQKIADKKGKKLVVNSAFRTQEEQIAIWNKFASTYPDPAERRKKVCDPSIEICPHPTGNAVDVVFEGKTTAAMTNNDWLLLHQIMSEAGWVRYGLEKRYDIGEPWHFECCGTKRYTKAKEKGVTAIV